MSARPILALTLLLAGAAVHAATEKWEISAAVEITGMPMPMSITPKVVSVCVPEGQMGNENMIPEKDGCRVSSFHTAGNTSTFNMQCPPPQNISGQGRFVRQGPDAYSGVLNATGNLNGVTVQMKTTYNGRRVGACDGVEAFTAPRAP